MMHLTSIGRKAMLGWRAVAEISPGVEPMNGIGSIGFQRLPTDAIGSSNVTFQGVNANSEIRIYRPDGAAAAGVENCVANPSLRISVFSVGSPNNTVRVVIIHPAYKIKEFSYTASLGDQSLPVQQELDKWYSNPA